MKRKSAALMISLPLGLPRATCLRTTILTGIVILTLAGVGRVQAITVPIDLGNPGTLIVDQRVAFDGLDQTSLLGQTLSVDFIFAQGEFARLFTVTSSSFDASVGLQTDSSEFVGFLNGTGYLLDDHGNALHTLQALGSAASDTGEMAVGLFPFFKDPSGTPSDELQKPVDFYGVHYDLTLPVNPSVELTEGQFRLFSDSGPFGIGPGVPKNIVPDTGTTLLLFAIGLIGLIGLRITVSRTFSA